MKEKTMYLYICPDCKILLMRPDKKYLVYNSSILTKDGTYMDEDSSEPFLDSYVCPSCGNATGEGDEQLKKIAIPIKRAEELINLWRSYCTIPASEELFTDYGIPLSDARLKEILLEELI